MVCFSTPCINRRFQTNYELSNTGMNTGFGMNKFVRLEIEFVRLALSFAYFSTKF